VRNRRHPAAIADACQDAAAFRGLRHDQDQDIDGRKEYLPEVQQAGIMSLAAFASAVLALLLAPGPTNTLIGVAGAQGGLGRVARLLPAELLGYLTAILPLAYLGADLMAELPAAALIVKVAAAAWVMLLAVRLWHLNPSGATGAITARRVYLTTFLNPKALIFALVLLPAPSEPDFAARLMMFCLMVFAVALLWGFAGTMTQIGAGGAGRLRLTQRIASLWLALLSLSLIAGALTTV
jgi:threonine/homoserine/homoserine lactone efflux protein